MGNLEEDICSIFLYGRRWVVNNITGYLGRHSWIGFNKDQFSSNQKCNFFSLKKFLMAKLGLLGISYWI